MRKTMIGVALALALAAGSCAQDVSESDEYRALEAELAGARARLDQAIAASDSAAAQPDAPNPRRERARAILSEIKQVLDDPASFGTEDEVADLLATHATETAVMEDDVFGAVDYRDAFYNTLFGGTTDAEIQVYDLWVSDDGSQGGVLWIWSGTNAAGNPFELAGVSLTEFAEDGRIAYELVTYPYPDDYVWEAFRGAGTPTPSTSR